MLFPSGVEVNPFIRPCRQGGLLRNILVYFLG